MDMKIKAPSECVIELIQRANKAPDPNDTMKLSQAALNAANAMVALYAAEKNSPLT